MRPSDEKTIEVDELGMQGNNDWMTGLGA